ncbi:delta 9-fatty acid desaturase protein [Amanita rubescens]|nr:delta 9-fatty acid desaturase protein [Amanita rubescens]
MTATICRRFPAMKGVRWFNVAVLTITPAIALYGILHASVRRETILFSAAYYIFTMLGYHRLWSHRSYNATFPLQVFLLSGGSSAVQGSCYWWARSHRSHHRHTDTDRDPYDSNRGILWTHIGWVLFKSDLRSGPADISDLHADELIQFQHRHYFPLAALFGYVLPTVIPALLWNDWPGGLCFSACFRLTMAHHSVFCINSIAHWLGSAPYDDALSPRDHVLSAILTMGEGYHNFHHQFPMDYRNAFLWYQYDPTKWFIALCGMLGLATNLRVFPSNEIKKGALSMQLKKLHKLQDSLKWPESVDVLPTVSWETFQAESKTRVLILVSGFIHDIAQFVDKHPGGKEILLKNTGKDMTAPFFGGVYAHSNAAHNVSYRFHMQF